MIDHVFWAQVNAAWSESRGIEFADRDKIRGDERMRELEKDSMDFSLD